MGLGTYLQTLAQAVLGQSATQPSVPQQPQGASSSPSTAPASPTPQSGGFMQGASNFLGNPLTQAALGGYFNAIGSPRLAGAGGRISAGGLGALQGFNTAEQNQYKTTEQQLEIQKAQAEAAQAAQQQKIFSGLTPDKQEVATFPGLASFQDKAAIQLNNKNAVAGFQAAHPGDTGAAAFSASYIANPKAVSPGDIEADWQTKQQGPGKLTAQTQDIEEKKAATKKDLAEAAHVGEATPRLENWFNPKTNAWRQGTSPMPGEVPESVVKSSKNDQEVKARASAWQKAYQDAKTSYIKTGTKKGWFGGATPPNESDVDAYAREQADTQVNALYGTMGTAAGIAADTSGAPPLPAGSTAYAVDADGNVGHVDSSGKFVPF